MNRIVQNMTAEIEGVNLQRSLKLFGNDLSILLFSALPEHSICG